MLIVDLDRTNEPQQIDKVISCIGAIAIAAATVFYCLNWIDKGASVWLSFCARAPKLLPLRSFHLIWYGKKYKLKLDRFDLDIDICRD
jgi:hypothetical protein